MSLENMLVQTCTVQRATRANSGGVVTSTYATVASGVPCNVQEVKNGIMHKDFGQGREYDADGYFAPSADIRPTASQADNPDQIVLSTGAKYRVVGTGDECGHGAVLNVYLRRVAP